MAEIPKKILPSIPLDPFDGQPIRYIHRDDGVTVYTIGFDGKDDGGAIEIDKTMYEDGQDLGFRLFNPDRRNLPALPRTTLPMRLVIGPNGEIVPATENDAIVGPPPREVGRE